MEHVVTFLKLLPAVYLLAVVMLFAWISAHRAFESTAKRLRYCSTFLLAPLYMVVFDPVVTGAVLALYLSWKVGAIYVGGFALACAIGVVFGEWRKSRTHPDQDIFTTPRWWNWVGDDQQGMLPEFLVAQWPSWVPRAYIAWSCIFWRNKLRNRTNWGLFKWLHVPRGQLQTFTSMAGSVHLTLRTRGWMTESEYWKAPRFGDFGPRLDWPDAWGGVTWAFRPYGRGT